MPGNKDLTAMSSDQTTTRSRLISAAEALFAERGVDAVSLREIGRVAGARNIAAAQYHFGDRTGLITAILEKHRTAVASARHRMLDEWQADGTGETRELTRCLVEPLAAKLQDPDGGLEFLRIYAELLNRPGGLGVPRVQGPRNSLERWAALVEPTLGADGDRLHRRFLAIRTAASELGRRARVRPNADHSLFLENLLDVLNAILTAPAADATSALLPSRPDKRRRQSGRSAFPVDQREL